MQRFGISTHLYHGERLRREHLLEIADAGFESVELFATESHFDYHDAAAIEALAGWLRDAHLQLPSVHAPIVDSLRNDQWGRAYSTATKDPARWDEMMREMRAAMGIATRIPFTHFVVHLGIPLSQNPAPQDNSRDAAIRTIEALHTIARTAGVTLALEVMNNSLSTADALVDLIERDLDGIDAGICMDVGHAFLLGETVDAIEETSGYLITTHLHDNRRRSDDHLVPFDGGIDWAATMMALEKIGYDGALMFEVKGGPKPSDVLKRTVNARRRLESLA